MNSVLQAALEELEHEGRKMSAPLGSSGLPGASERDVRLMLEPLGLIPNDELLTWFHWHNGWSDAYCTTPDNMAPFDLQRAVDSCRMMRDIALDVASGEGPEKVEAVWRSTFFPITGESGDWMVIDTAPDSPKLSTRYYYRDTGSWGAAAAPSLGSVVQTWVDDLKTGQTYWTPPSPGWSSGVWEGEHRGFGPPRGFENLE
jgi:hypothetical protein